MLLRLLHEQFFVKGSLLKVYFRFLVRPLLLYIRIIADRNLVQNCRLLVEGRTLYRARTLVAHLTTTLEKLILNFSTSDIL